jgi:hypothetical protein
MDIPIGIHRLMSDKILIRKVLKQYSEGQISWRKAAVELLLEDYSELMSLMLEYEIPFPAFEGKSTHEGMEIPPSLSEEN